MIRRFGSNSLTRRQLLSGSARLASGTLIVGLPAIIGRASSASAQAAFSGEAMIVGCWSGIYQQIFDSEIVEPFNAKYGTKVETLGGWDQLVPQIKAAPADNPPYDICVGEEYTSALGLGEEVWLPQDLSKTPNAAAVYEWFYETRPKSAAKYGIPFGGGTCMLLMRSAAGLPGESWQVLWDERLSYRVTLDSASWFWALSIPAILRAKPGISEMWDYPSGTENLFQSLAELRVARWYKDGVEQAYILNQGLADAAMSYSSDTLTYQNENPGEYLATVPNEGTAAWTDWYFKVRGTKHSDLGDLFLNFLLEKETQEKFHAKSYNFAARRDVTIPSHWNARYPQSNEDFRSMFQLLTIDGWAKLGPHLDQIDARVKKIIETTTAR